MQPKPIILGFNSNVGKSGKDTLCDMLNAKRFAFADALKEQTSLMLAVDTETRKTIMKVAHDQRTKDMEFPEFAVGAIPASHYKCHLRQYHDVNVKRSLRWHLQQYGMYRRNQNPDVWCDYTLGDIEGFMESSESINYEFIVVTDVRMRNEMAYIQNLGGIVIRIERTWCEPSIDRVPKHISDIDLNDAGLPVIYNCWGSPEYMVDQLKEILRDNQVEI